MSGAAGDGVAGQADRRADLGVSGSALGQHAARTRVLAALALVAAAVLVWRMWPAASDAPGRAQAPSWPPCPSINSDVTVSVDRFVLDGRGATVFVALANRTESAVRISGFSLATLVRGGQLRTHRGEVLFPDTLEHLMLHPPPFAVDFATQIEPGGHVVWDMRIELQELDNGPPAAGSLVHYQLRGQLVVSDVNFEGSKAIEVCGEGSVEIE